jgi:hypothetical protein
MTRARRKTAGPALAYPNHAISQEARLGTRIAQRRGMKRIFLVLLLVSMLASTVEARAQPNADDALADGEIDPEDYVLRATVGRSSVRVAPGGSAWVSLVGFTRSASAVDQEIGGLLVVGLPFDRFARASTRTPLPEPPRPPPPPPVTPALAASETADLVVTPRLARATVAAAWRCTGLGADDARLEGILSRARWSALLPETRLRAVRFQDERLSTTDTGSDATRLYDAAGANLGLEARLTWRLDRLIYADDEPAFERMKLERHDARSRVASRVLDALFHWQRAWLDLRSLGGGARGTRDELEAALKLMEAEAALDVLTAGWFSTQKPQRVVVLAPALPRSDL